VLAWAVAAVLATLAAVRLLGGGEGAAPAPVRVEGGEVARAGPAGGVEGSDRAQMYVHVAGAVRRPGLLRLPAGSRAAVAIERAGGFTRRADVTAVNLAAELRDGQQIVVPKAGGTGVGASSVGPAGGSGASGAVGAKPSPATATLEQLDAVDGIGPTLAERIIEHRDEAGGLATVAGLREVEGIGEARFEALREALQP
jgi:competence protein ComEA